MAYNSEFVSMVNTVESIASITLSKAFKLGNILNKLIEQAIYIATGIDCYTIANRIPERISEAKEVIVAEGSESSCQSEELITKLEDKRSTVNDVSKPDLKENSAIYEIQNLALDHKTQYEESLRKLEFGLINSDTILVENTLDSIYKYSGIINDDISNLLGPIFACYEHAYTSVPGIRDSINYINNWRAQSDSLRFDLWNFSEIWLSDAQDESSRLAALNQIDPTIDSYKGMVASINELILQLFNTPADPFIVLTGMSVPDSIETGNSANISVYAQNLGAGTARDVEINLSTDSTKAILENSGHIFIDSLVAGEKKKIDFDLHMLSLNLEADSVYTLLITFTTNSNNSLSNYKSRVIPIVKNTVTDAEPEREISRSCVKSIYPNPFNPEVTIEFEIANNNTFVQISIYDIRGRKVKTLISRNLDSGIRKVTWNGTSNSNQKISSGIYFCKIDINNRTETRKIVLLK